MSDMNELIRERAGRSTVDAPEPTEAEQTWQALDRDARRQGWHRGGHALHHRMRDDETYQQWFDGRAEFEPGYTPATPSLGLGFVPSAHGPGRTMNDQVRQAIRWRSGR